MFGRKLNSKKIVEDYILEKDWRVKENANSPKSFGGLNKYISSEISKDYWLNHIYPKRIRKAYINGDMHIHDLGGLTLYCCGFSLENVLLMGVQGVDNIPTSAPASHFDSALSQIANLITVYQNEIMGAVALNSVDTMLAPFIAKDNLTQKQVKQSLQNFIFAINSNSRGGAEPAFSNITLDITPPDDMLNKPIIISGEYQNSVFGDYQKEMDMFNKSFTELMLKGDSVAKPFAYPIITYNINKRFDWDNPANDTLFEMAGKFGYPYFSNYINSDMETSDIRSMCCHLRLNLTELKKRSGGLFGSGDSTGAIGVASINLPRIGYLAKSKKDFYKRLDEVLDLAYESLEIKRAYLQDVVLKQGMLPAFMRYVGTIDNHFSVIGDIGKNEMCENFLGKGHGILSEDGHKFTLEVGEHIISKTIEFQVKSGHLYNYEATPAEGTCYSLALKDVKKFGKKIITRGTLKSPYYTNSCHIPVGEVTSIKQVYDNQDELQCQYTGGTVIHNYLNGAISGAKAKSIIKTIMYNYKAPYSTLSPISRYCPSHGYIEAHVDICPQCGAELELYQIVTGYIRPISRFNDGKAEEFKERHQMEEREL